jgi:chaperonin GroES
MLKPLGDRVLVRLDESLPSAAGIYLATDVSKWREATDQIGNRGTVVAVGPGRRNSQGQVLPMSVRVGDVVRFSELEYPRDPVDKQLALISEMDITTVEEPA